MVIRFPRLRLARPSHSVRRLQNTDPVSRRLSRAELEHRERMLRHLELVERHR